MKLYQFEMHCHTAETSPCGVLTATEVVDGFKAAGYRGVFITDHFYSRYFEQRRHRGAALGAAGGNVPRGVPRRKKARRRDRLHGAFGAGGAAGGHAL